MSRPVTWFGMAAAALFGLIFLYIPFQFQTPIYTVIYPHARLFGAGFIAAALLLASGAAKIGAPRRMAQAGKSLLALGLLGLVLTVTLPFQLWSRTTTHLLLISALMLSLLNEEKEELIAGWALALLPTSFGLFILAGPHLFPPSIQAGLTPVLGAALLGLGLLQLLPLLPGRPHPSHWWLVPLALSLPLAWLAAIWGADGNWTGTGLHGLLAAGSLLWGLYQRRPWSVRLAGLQRRILAVSIGLSVLPVLALGAAAVYAIERADGVEAAGRLTARLTAADALASRLADSEAHLDTSLLSARLAELPPLPGAELQILPAASTPPHWSADRDVLEELPPGQERHLVAYAKRPDLGITLAITWPTVIVYANATRLATLFLTIMLTATGFAILLSHLLSKRLTRQLHEVRAVAAEVGKLHFEARVDQKVIDDDEVNDLASILNEMSAALETYHEEIQAQNEELQAQQEELSAQNEELFAQTEELQAQNEALLERDLKLVAGRQRQAFLSRAGALLAGTLDLSETLHQAAHLPVPFLCDWCEIALSDEAEHPIVVHDAPARQRVMVPSDSAPLFEPHDPNMLLQVPLITRGRELGMITLGLTHPHRSFGPEETTLAEDLAGRIALALDNARLYTTARSAVARLEETVAFLDTVLSSATIGFAFVDRDLRFVRVNEAMAEINGISVQAHLGRTMREIIPHVADLMEPIVHHVLGTGTPVPNWEMSGQTTASPGVTRHWLGSSYPVQLPDGRILGVGTMALEITERKQTEESLRRSEALLADQRKVLEQIATGAPLQEILHTLATLLEERLGHCHCAVLLLDEQGTNLRVVAAPTLAPGFQQALDGWPLTPTRGTCGAALFQKQPTLAGDLDSDPVWSERAAAAREYGMRSSWSFPILDADDYPLGTISIFTRTPRTAGADELELIAIATRMAGVALQRHQMDEQHAQKLHLLLRNMAEGVVAIDDDHRIVFINQAAERLLNLSAVGVGQALGDTGLPASLIDALTGAAAAGTYHPQRVTFTHEGTAVDVHISPIYTELSRYGAIAVLQDVTAEVQFRHLQESFVANVSHELRGPLASVSATLEALADGVIPEANRQRYLQSMLAEMERLRRLSYDVVDLTRLDSGLVQLEREPFHLGFLFTAIQEKSLQRCDSAGLELLVDPPELYVLADHDRVNQVITNLLDNAIRFTPAGGTLRLFARKEGSLVRICLADTGVGIPPEDLPYIWERFYKVDKARTLRPGSGTGLGLAIVRQLVEQMGGQVQMESEPGKGSTVSITLPLAGPPAA